LPCLFKAASLLRKDAEAHYNLGNALRDHGLLTQAQASYQRALKLQPDLAQAHFNLSVVFKEQGRLREAATSYRRALQIQPDYPDALVAGAEALASIGRFDEAQAQLDRAVALQPLMPEAWAALATIRRMGPQDADWLDKARYICSLRLSPQQESRLRFAMGKHGDDLGDHPRAFADYTRANELKKTFAPAYQPRRQTQLMDQIRSVYTREALARVAPEGSDSQRPLFVVGMPRSGTSLVEQILASHPQAFGAGELPFWEGATSHLQLAGLKSMPDKAWRRSIAAKCLHELELQCRTAARVVDKMPANFHHLGLIHAVFPRARILHVQRHPLDTCLSIYFQNFNASHSYANDLADLAHYYREYHRLMAHWRAVLPAHVFMDVSYEELVNDQQPVTRRIVEFAGLPWDARCLRFHTTDRPVQTSSKWQVRQQLYTRAIQRWRRYDAFLGPLAGLQELAS
jgi:tetratricopeptide (TPR) repeat protein